MTSQHGTCELVTNTCLANRRPAVVHCRPLHSAYTSLRFRPRAAAAEPVERVARRVGGVGGGRCG